MNANLTGAIYVVDELDFETKQNYDLIIRATDSVSGVYAEVPLSIAVSGNNIFHFQANRNLPRTNRFQPFNLFVALLCSDVNDCPPTLPQDNYDVTVSESTPFGSVILKVNAHDNDGPGRARTLNFHINSVIITVASTWKRILISAVTIFLTLPFSVCFRFFFANSGLNSEITYTIQTDSNKNSSEFFHIDENEGTVYLRKALDHETLQHHHFTIRASDKGSPALSSSKMLDVTNTHTLRFLIVEAIMTNMFIMHMIV